MTELMTIDEVAAYFGVSQSRAYSLVSENGIQRVSGYPAGEVKAILRVGQGARTDLRVDMSECTCVVSCADDPPTMCSLSGINHVHPDDGSGTFGPCPIHPDAPGDH